jgi:hypothetical protein
VLSGLAIYAGNRTAIFEITASLRADADQHPSPDRSAQKLSCFGEDYEAMLVDFVVLESYRAELAVGKGAAVKQEPDAARPGWFRSQEVNTHQPAASDVQCALLQDLAPAGLPRGLSGGVDLTAGNRPPLLVIGFQNQQPTSSVEDQGAGRARDPRNPVRGIGADRIAHLTIIADAVDGGHRPTLIAQPPRQARCSG